MLRIGVLASGRGSNLLALLRRQVAGALGGEVVLVASNRPCAGALSIAREHGIETCVSSDAYGRSRADAQVELSELLRSRDVELVVLAGYDRILTGSFVRCWPGRIINVHPSLLPAFGGGLHAQRDALEYGAKVTGCTVHFVTEELDSGPIVSQAAVPVLESDDERSLSERILREEHQLLPAAVCAFAEGRLEVRGRTVYRKGD
ncbi:MAG: phosphoribosylglycinamide formyltransferase [Chloroflexota bacterium]|nr:phosphoribosylglycinamide formyltransferase [Chloroflexota bacterium]